MLYIYYLGSDYCRYTETENGSNPNTDAFLQNVEEGDTIEPVTIVPTEYLSEQGDTYKLHMTYDHPYMKYDTSTNEWVADAITSGGTTTPIRATDMPLRLSGWQILNPRNQELVDLTEPTLSSAFISDFFDGTTLADLYAKWGYVDLVRVMVFIPEMHAEISTPPVCSCTLTTGTSYTVQPNNPYGYLTNNFKIINDTVQRNDKRPYDISALDEFGTGDGCPVSNASVDPLTYYGIIPNDKVSLTLTITAGNYLPYFVWTTDEYNTERLEYRAFFFDRLTRQINEKLFDDTYCTVVPLTKNNNQMVWNAPTGNSAYTVNSDVTMMVPLKMKPLVSTIVSPRQAGSAYIDDGTATPPSSALFMPGDTCTLSTQTTHQGRDNDTWNFIGWADSHGTALPQAPNTTITYNVKDCVTVVAIYERVTPIIYEATVNLSYRAQNPSHTLSGSPFPVSYRKNNTGSWTDLSNTPVSVPVITTSGSADTLTMRAYKTANGTGMYSNMVYTFESFRVYYGDATPDPMIDRGLGMSGTFPQGGSYTVTESTNYWEVTITNLANEAVYGLYAFYLPPNL